MVAALTGRKCPWVQGDNHPMRRDKELRDRISAKLKGRKTREYKKWQSKLPISDIIAIQESSLSCRKLGEMYGVSGAMISTYKTKWPRMRDGGLDAYGNPA